MNNIASTVSAHFVIEPNTARPSSIVAALTSRMAKGDDQAFREFHARFFGRLFRYILVLMRGDEHGARDVAQETLLRVVRHVHCFEDEGVFWDWLARLARTAGADHGRRTSRYVRLLQVFSKEPSELGEPMTEGECPGALSQSLAELDENDRTLLSRKYEEGLTVRQLAASHGVTEAAIESRLARARAALRVAVFRHLRHENS